jgi:Transposase.
MITVFWNCDGVLLVDAVLREETFNSEIYIRTLTDLRKCFI